jgi:ATP-dependent RNA helicase RhlE
MEFTSFDLPPDLLRGVSELGFTRPTTIQEQAIPPAMAGRDLLACAATGSGKTAAFLLPIIRRLMTQPRGKTRALILTPTRELAAQIHQHPYARLDSLELLVLDEADRMLDMGFLPDIRRVLKQIPQKRQTLFFSATMPQPIVKLSQEMLSDPATINLERKAAPASGITQALYPVPADLKSALFLELLRRDEIRNAIVFLRTKHRTNRLFDQLERAGVPVARIHGNRSQAQRTEALAGFKSGKYRILVATDIVARGIDVEALEHVVNFDVPAAPEDYIHRVGRTARAEAIGDAITFVSPEEEGDLRAIERAIGRAIPRVTVPDFDYRQRAGERFEVPLAERIAAIRARKAEERARSRAKSERASQVGAEQGARTGGGSGSGGSGGSGAGRRRRGGRGRGTGGGAPRQG